MSKSLQIPRLYIQELVAHAQAERPNECCGFLAGTDGLVSQRYALTNAAASPTLYEAEPHDLFRAFKEMRRTGTELLAIYHSHPTSDAVPSRTDVARNFYGADVVHLIVSLKGESPTVRGWSLGETSVREVAVHIIDLRDGK